MDNVNCRNVQLLNEAERICYKNYDTFLPCDAVLSAVFLFPDKCVRKKQRHHATVELQGNYTRGQMLIDHRKIENPNVTVIELVNEEELKKALLFAAGIGVVD